MSADMSVADALTTQFNFNLFVLKANTDGISDGEALEQPPSGGNCLNWVVGHIVSSRSSLLKMLGGDATWSDEQAERYARGSEPVTGREGTVPLSQMKLDLEASQAPLLEAIQGVSQEQLAQPAPFSPTNNPDETIGTLLAGLAFHEAYHSGQTGVLRHVCGKPGAIS